RDLHTAYRRQRQIVYKRQQLHNLFKEYNFLPHFQPINDSVEKLHQVEGIIIGSDNFTKEMFHNAKKLRAIIKYGVGTDNINKEAAEKFNVKILNLPSINSDAVAEMALGLMLSVARKITESDRLLRKGTWSRPLGCKVQGKALGIIGTGAIGLCLARMVEGLNMKLLGFDIKKDQSFIKHNGKYVPLEELLNRSDFISIHVPLNENTYHLIGEKQLSIMKPTAILINTSRGGAVDERALFKALHNHTIAGAGVDVFETQPAVQNPLLGLENTVCTSHIAAYDSETLRKMDAECLEKLHQALETTDN
ncbi:MAG: phosphoglycerate dehydrogenase, partial [Spirochaetota bacterium]